MHEHAATRLFVFPVAGRRRWAFIAKPPSLLHPPGEVPKVLPGSVSPGEAPSGGGGIPGMAWVRGTLAMGREMMEKARGAKDQNERVEIVADYLADSMHDQWVKLEASPEKTWKRRVFNWGSVLLSRIRASETLFKTVPKKAPGLEIVYPLGMHPTLVRRRVRLLAKGGEILHTRSLYGATAILPFVMVLGVLPVPNLPFFWNVFRIHAHWSAMRGSKRVLELSTVPAIEGGERGKKGEEEEKKSLTIEPLKMSPSEDLAALTLDPGVQEHLPDEAISKICENLELDNQLVMKWRDQDEKKAVW